MKDYQYEALAAYRDCKNRLGPKMANKLLLIHFISIPYFQTSSKEVCEKVVELIDSPLYFFAKAGRHTGVCQVCSRLLTDEASIEAGIGPVCKEKISKYYPTTGTGLPALAKA